MDRRDFLEGAAIAVGSFLIDDGLLRGAQRVRRMIGIQAGAISFRDEGTDKALENFQQLGAVDTVFLATFTYGRGIAGRMPRGTPLPDHGKQEYDDDFHGGNFATPHPQYFRGTTLQPEKAPDHPDYDVIADVLPRGTQATDESDLLVRGCLPRRCARDYGRVRSGRARPSRDPGLLPQSQHPQLLAGTRRGPSSIVRRGRSDVRQ
jgi:hypothetical protein